MLTEICQELNNWFVLKDGKHYGSFTIEDGALAASFLLDGQYFRIVGSIFNDGVYKYGPDGDTLTDETFDGAVWALAIPPAVLELDADIEDWATKNADAINSPFQSESFGGYSYSKGYSNGGGIITTWQGQFSERLNKWRKIK